MALDKQFCLKSQILVLYAKLQRIFPDFATAMIVMKLTLVKYETLCKI
jgi:hypothetical protein